jgi:hypothetical protein
MFGIMFSIYSYYIFLIVSLVEIYGIGAPTNSQLQNMLSVDY